VADAFTLSPSQRRGGVNGELTSRTGDRAASKEKIALVGFPFRPAVSSEPHFFGIVGAEFVAKELTVGSSPRLQLSVYDRQALCAKRASSRSVSLIEAFAHLLSLTPIRNAIPVVRLHIRVFQRRQLPK
jgi:hypothetical protein